MDMNELLVQIQKIVNKSTDELRQELKQEIKTSNDELRTELYQEINKINLKIELDIERKIDIILDYIALQQEKETQKEQEISIIEEKIQENELKILNHENRIEALEKNSHLETVGSYH